MAGVEDMLTVMRYDVRASGCCGGFQYHYKIDGEEYTSFNYWPTRHEALNAAVDEIKAKLSFRAAMDKLQKSVTTPANKTRDGE